MTTISSTEREHRCGTVTSASSATRDLFFSESSFLRWYVDATTIKDRVAETRASLVLLYSINNMLWNWRDNEAKAIEFLENSTYTINQSVAIPVLKEGRRQMEAKESNTGRALHDLSLRNESWRMEGKRRIGVAIMRGR
jgi:hypothetical protein